MTAQLHNSTTTTEPTTKSIIMKQLPGLTFTSTSASNEFRFDEHYKLLSKLSKGSFGIVYVTEHLSTHEEYAVKVIERSELNDKEKSSVEREVSILHDFRDVDQIVKLVDFYVSPDRFYVVQQYAQGGDVFERLAQRTSYTEKDARDLAVHLLQAIKVLHDRKLAHRDLKPENLLLREMFDDTAILVADFGFASYVPPEGLKTRCGTPAFVAPQILIPNCRYDERVDMWSVGCLLYMLIAGYPPFQDRNHRGLFRKVRGADFVFHDMYWKNVSKSAKQLIASMLTLDPRYRCTAAMALEKSAWLKMDPELLREHDLGASLGEIKRFHARRTLKSAIHAVIWTAKYKTKSADEALFNNRIKSGWDFMTNAKDDGGKLDVMNMNENFNNTATIDSSQEDTEHQHAPRRRQTMPGSITSSIVTSGEQLQQDFSLKSDSILLTRLRPSLSFQDVYVLRELLHCGQTAKVYECYHKKTKDVYAVKIIERNNDENKKSVVGRTLTETVLHEVAILDSLNHTNIIQIKEFFEDDECFYLLMERMYGHDVFEQIMKRTKIPESDAKILAKSLLEAVAHFHEQGIAHRDLKPQNLLLKDEKDFSTVKITDFGFACRVHTPQSLTTRCGTPSYVAPEVLKNIPYDQSSDMWSVGIILYLLLSGNPPFIDDNQSELFRKIRTADWKFKGEEWDSISYEAKSLIKKCLIANPIQRITAKQALQRKWFVEEVDADRKVASSSVTSQQQSVASVVRQSPIPKAVVDSADSEGELEGQMAVERAITVQEPVETSRRQSIRQSVTVVSLSTSNAAAPQDVLGGKIEQAHNTPRNNNPDVIKHQSITITPEPAKDPRNDNAYHQKGTDDSDVPKEYSSTNQSYLPAEDGPLRRDDIGTSGHSPRTNNNKLRMSGAPLNGSNSSSNSGSDNKNAARRVIDAPATTVDSTVVTDGISSNNRASIQAQKFIALMQGRATPSFVDNHPQQVDNAMVDYYYEGPNSPTPVDQQRKVGGAPMMLASTSRSPSRQRQAAAVPPQRQQYNEINNQIYSPGKRIDSQANPRDRVNVSPQRRHNHNEGGRSRDPDGVVAANVPIGSLQSQPMMSNYHNLQQQQPGGPVVEKSPRRRHPGERRSKTRHSEMTQEMERLEI